MLLFCNICIRVDWLIFLYSCGQCVTFSYGDLSTPVIFHVIMAHELSMTTGSYVDVDSGKHRIVYMASSISIHPFHISIRRWSYESYPYQKVFVLIIVCPHICSFWFGPRRRDHNLPKLQRPSFPRRTARGSLARCRVKVPKIVSFTQR